MKNLSIMIKPASSGCNLRCKYCFYADVASLREMPSFGLMSRDTMEKLLTNIRRDLVPGDRICFGFQGGEPTLAGLAYFREFVGMVGEHYGGIRTSFSIQTNGTLLDDKWCAFLAGNHFLVGLSLDLLPDCHDAVRVDAQGGGTYKRVVETIHMLRRHRAEFNVLCTLTNQVARHPAKVWKQIRQLDLPYVQFTPCLDELESPGASPYALTPERFGSFYIQLFREWLTDYRRGEYRSVKFFDDLVNLLAYGMPTACGIDGLCRPQLVVEADGSVYPCDFYCLDRYKTGNLAENSLREIYESPVNSAFLQRPHTQPALCGACPFARLCGGGCRRMQGAFCRGNTCGCQNFLTAAIGDLQIIARQQRARRGL